MGERKPLEVGMLLLDDAKHPAIWTVKSVAQKSARIIAHHGTVIADAKLRIPHVPEGWVILNNGALAQFLTEMPEKP